MDGLNIVRILAELRNPMLYLRKIRQNDNINTKENFNINENINTPRENVNIKEQFDARENINFRENIINNKENLNNNRETILNNNTNIRENPTNNKDSQKIKENITNNNDNQNIRENITTNKENLNIRESIINNRENINAKNNINISENITPKENVNTPNNVNSRENFGSSKENNNSSFSQSKSLINNQPQKPSALNNQLPMNQITSMDRSVYVKNILGLPQTLGEILQLAQTNTPINKNTLIIENLNEELIKNQKVLSQIFDEVTELNPILQNQVQLNTQAVAQKDAIALIFSGMIHMPAIADMITKNSKQAVASLIIAMASASKSGMTNEQIRETLSIINSCVSMAESGNTAQTLKSLMLLYLPWLPLNEGVGFDLEVETANGENESNDSKLTVLIQTINFGNVKGVFTLKTSNSVDIFIVCSEGFPKNILQKSLSEEASSHSMNMTIDVEAIKPKKDDPNETREAKVNLSATNEMNPYLLLMAHAFIRNTIYIDSNGVIEEDPAEERI